LLSRIEADPCAQARLRFGERIIRVRADYAVARIAFATAATAPFTSDEAARAALFTDMIDGSATGVVRGSLGQAVVDAADGHGAPIEP